MRADVFMPLYHSDRLKVFNPVGDVGVITFWSPIRTVERKLLELVPEQLSFSDGRIAVMGNLYGDGFLAMFANLLYNPQIRYLAAIGQDLKLGVPEEIEAFLRHGLERAEILGQPVWRVPGTTRALQAPDGFNVGRLQDQVSFKRFGKLSGEGFADEVCDWFAGLPPVRPAPVGERIKVDLPEPSASDFAFLPSDPFAHQVMRPRPLDCWEEVVFRVMRFGRPVELAKGPRLELNNVRVVISEPMEEREQDLAGYGFSLKQFRAYQRRILEPDLPPDISYSYGNRIRGYYSDSLDIVISRLRADPETRHAYVSLWDTGHDLFTPDQLAPGEKRSVPCLTTLFFRRASDGRLSVTASYRSHNLLTAWLENVYGLIAIQRHVAGAIGMERGVITVISHSLTINPRESRFALADQIVSARKKDELYDRERKKYLLREDPHGYFAVSIDEDTRQIIAEHKYQNVVINRYSGRTANEVEEQIACDITVSLTSHAMYLGRQLCLAEQSLHI